MTTKSLSPNDNLHRWAVVPPSLHLTQWARCKCEAERIALALGHYYGFPQSYISIIHLPAPALHMVIALDDMRPGKRWVRIDHR